jgi:Fe-S cluster assembly protein SufD
MTTMTASKKLTLPDLAGPDGAAISAGPAWLSTLRKAAMARFDELGIPTLKDEEWRFTNLAPLVRTDFREAPARGATVLPDDVAAAGIDLPGAFRLVFVDGRLAPALSRLTGLPAGVTIAPLHEALQSHRELVEPHLARSIGQEQDPFAALNTALMRDGAFIHVARGVMLERPIILQSLASAGEHPTASHPRNLILVDEGASATVIEDYAQLPAPRGGGDSVYLTNALTEIVLGAGARADHYFLERESRKAFNISTLRAHQARGSNLASHSILLGGALVRNNVHLTLDGEGCESLLNGLFIPGQDQHIDNHMRVFHNQPRCNSRQYYKGVLDGNGRGVFSGRIYVAQDAQKTDAIQRNANLLLSPEAQIDTKPQLEIYADDVRCTHGATIGQLDPNSLFYLKARGLTEAAARAMLVYAFAGESLDRMALEPLRDRLRAHVVARLPMGAALAEVL